MHYLIEYVMHVLVFVLRTNTNPLLAQQLLIECVVRVPLALRELTVRVDVMELSILCAVHVPPIALLGTT